MSGPIDDRGDLIPASQVWDALDATQEALRKPFTCECGECWTCKWLKGTHDPFGVYPEDAQQAAIDHADDLTAERYER